MEEILGEEFNIKLVPLIVKLPLSSSCASPLEARVKLVVSVVSKSTDDSVPITR
ncbi:MAG: hypothetical protein ACJ0QA_02750 [Flavobacteriaceae bacterium]